MPDPEGNAKSQAMPECEEGLAVLAYHPEFSIRDHVCTNVFRVCRESFVQPQVIPPFHCDQIAEPLNADAGAHLVCWESAYIPGVQVHAQ